MILAGGITLPVIASIDRIERVRIIFEGSSLNRDELANRIVDEIGDIPDCVSVDCQRKHWMDGSGVFNVFFFSEAGSFWCCSFFGNRHALDVYATVFLRLLRS